MRGRRIRAVGVFVLVLVTAMLTSGIARAQTSASTIAGIVKDPSGAVLPGVTVEASSPSLIEKTRSAVTDGSGNYAIPELRPGVYSVMFTLPGFSAVKREGIELTTGFTATVNAELKVGSVEETITVSGASPVVDLQNTQQTRVITAEVKDAIPTGRNYANLGVLIPGMQVTGVAKGTYQDVGGNVGNAYVVMGIHGGRNQDQMPQMQGMSWTMLSAGNGGYTWASPSEVAFEETSLGTGSHPAEQETGGVQINYIPKSGGNIVHGTVFGTFGHENLQSDNFSQALKAAGLPSVNKLNYFADINPGIGGPVKKDRLWLYGSFRTYRFANYKPFFYAADPNAFQYTPGPEIALDRELTTAVSGHVTWQVSPRNRFTAFHNYDDRCDCDFGPLTNLPNAQLATTFRDAITQLTWTSPVTSRFMLDAGLSWLHDTNDWLPYSYSVSPSVTDQSTGFTYRGYSGGGTQGPIYDPGQIENNVEAHVSALYALANHSLKVGLKVNPSWYHGDYRSLGDDYQFSVLNGVCFTPPCAPVVARSVTYLATPYTVDPHSNKMSVFGQDQWKRNRLTVNAGLRLDWFRTWYPDGSQPAKRWVGPISWSGATVLNWTDLSPRLGMVYDLFGDNKTAIKVNLARYVIQEAAALTVAYVPWAQNRSVTRTWTDSNGDWIPQGDPNIPGLNGQLGPSPNTNFGTTVQTVFYDPKWASGFNVRPANWEFAAGVQREIVPRVSADATFIRRSYINFSVSNNEAVAATDYSPYCIATPVDGRLPDGGGQPLCGLFDLNPNKLGQIHAVTTAAKNFGDQSEVWQGIDIGLQARLPGRLTVQGGVSVGRVTADACDIVKDNPQIAATLVNQTDTTGTITTGPSYSTDFCRVETPFIPNYKALGSYILPGGVQVAATFQSLPGTGLRANYVVSNALIAPSLKRNLSAGANGTVTTNVIAPGTVFNERYQQVDLRFSKLLTFGAMKTKVNIDLYNMFNSDHVIVRNLTYGTNGASWLVPQQILAARIVKFGFQLDF